MKTPEEEDVIILKNICKINYYKYEHICVFMFIFFISYIIALIENKKNENNSGTEKYCCW